MSNGNTFDLTRPIAGSSPASSPDSPIDSSMELAFDSSIESLESSFEAFDPALDSGDVRCAKRFPVQLPVQVVTRGGEYEALTENVSASGVLFVGQEALAVDTTVELFLRMPAGSIGATEDVVVQCVGRVTRCSPGAAGVHVAALIDDYRFGKEKRLLSIVRGPSGLSIVRA